MMDITPYLGPMVTALIAIVGAYVAMKNANAAQFQELKVDVARVETKVDDLSAQVERHNRVVERTYQLETKVDTAFHRIDELRERDERIEDRMERLHQGGE